MPKHYGPHHFSAARVVLAYMKGHNGRIDVREHFDFYTIPPDNIHKAISYWRKRGVLVRVSHGVYVIADSTTPTASP